MNIHRLAQNFIIQPTTLPGQPTVPPVNIKGPVTFNSIGDVINLLLTFLFPISTVILFFIIVWGGYDYLMSGGESSKIQAGRAKITSGLIGFGLLVFSYVFAKLVGYIFGIGNGIL